MNFFIREVEFEAGERYLKTAWSKARSDIDAVFESMGMNAIRIITHEKDRKYATGIKKMYWHEKSRQAWKKALSSLSAGDCLFVQFPILDHSLFLFREFRRIQKIGVKIILIVHDLEILRFSLLNNSSKLSNFRLKLEEVAIIRQANFVILHNKKMIRFATQLKLDEKKTIDLEIFDYLYSGDILIRRKEQEKIVIIAGNLSEEKAGYVYKLPGNVRFNLYGINYNDRNQDNIDYKGSFLPDILPGKLEGGFGLVWDGSDANTCSGIYGQYLKINNPHKTSLYLASNIPVIVWSQAAIADFVVDNGVGIAIDSLDELDKVINGISEKDYNELVQRTRLVGEKMRTGYYTQKAIKTIMKSC